jgi:hypothetical protein
MGLVGFHSPAAAAPAANVTATATNIATAMATATLDRWSLPGLAFMRLPP